ncbi:MAG: glycosyltransferase family 4 protein, partial [Alphaproteobacteria bacterium]
MALGFRGFPGVQGGVEVHAENIYRRLASRGCDVEIVMRSPSVPEDIATRLPGISVKRLWAPARTGIEALVHTFLGTLYAALKRPDVLHIHAIGPALMTPLARLFGVRVVITHHSLNYEHEKWGR